MWTFIKQVFKYPVYVSLLVGAGIHGLLAINAYIFAAPGYIQALEQDLVQRPLYGLVHLLIPFAVPYLVSWIARQILEETEIKSAMRFPQANPNPVLKLDPKGKVIFQNQATNDLLRSLGRDPRDVLSVLPSNTNTIVEKLVGTDQTWREEITLDSRVIQYQFKAFSEEEAVIITGTDVTRLRHTEERLKDINTHLVGISNMVDQSLVSFNSLDFDLFHYFKNILKDILRNPGEPHYDKPLFILLGLGQPDGSFKGYLFRKEDGVILVEKESIQIQPPSQYPYAIHLGHDEVFWANQETSGLSSEDFQKYFHPDVQKRVGVIHHFATYTSADVALIGFYRHYSVRQLDAQLLKNLTVYARTLKLVADQVQETEDAFLYTIKALARAAEANDEDTGNHILRVNEYSRLFAEALGLDSKFVHTIHYSAQMHDVGKIHVHPDILRKPGKLSATEIQLMKLHTETGARILGDEPRLNMAREIAHAHHERYDGSGYPRHLKGDEIPLAARIVTVADVYDALRQKRVYKPSMSHDEAVNIITQGDGRVHPKHFDPSVLNVFSSNHRRVEDIFEQMKNESLS